MLMYIFPHIHQNTYLNAYIHRNITIHVYVYLNTKIHHVDLYENPHGNHK